MVRDMTATTTDVRCERSGAGWTCRVEIRRDGRRVSSHRVAVADETLARLDPGAADPERLVRASFAFLLERESSESILTAFDLPVIARYFPEYEREIARRTAGG